MVIPPVFAAKADYRSIEQHLSSLRNLCALCASAVGLYYHRRGAEDAESRRVTFNHAIVKIPLIDRNQIAVPWLLMAFIALIYLAFPTRVYYWDGIAFAQAIEDASGLNASLVHPNHLIYNFVGYIFYKLLLSLGFQLRAITALQILNCVLSAACAGVLFGILMDTLRSVYLSVCLTLLFAFSATWWKFSTDANAYIPSVLFILISFWLVLPRREPKPLLLALVFFISMAFHQLAVVMFPVLALGVYLQDGAATLKRRAFNAILFTVASFVLIVATYSFLFYLAGSFEIARLVRWTASYSPDADTKFHFWSNLQYSLRGQVRLFFGGRFNLLKGLGNPFVVVLIVALVSAVVFMLVEGFRHLKSLRYLKQLRLETRQKTVLLLTLSWLALYLIFLFFWLPQNTFYRLFYFPAFILLLGIALNSFRKRVKTSRRFTALLVISVALANFLFLIYPFSNTQKYPPLAFALQMNREWPAGTVIYYGAENTDKGLVRYFNPATIWRLLRPDSLDTLNDELRDIYNNGGTAWFETTAIDQLASTAEGSRWLETNVRKESWKELNHGAYKIRFVQIGSDP
jgi:hypothetical protein